MVPKSGSVQGHASGHGTSTQVGVRGAFAGDDTCASRRRRPGLTPLSQLNSLACPISLPTLRRRPHERLRGLGADVDR
jgi:hypothetical protein